MGKLVSGIARWRLVVFGKIEKDKSKGEASSGDARVSFGRRIGSERGRARQQLSDL